MNSFVVANGGVSAGAPHPMASAPAAAMPHRPTQIQSASSASTAHHNAGRKDRGIFNHRQFGSSLYRFSVSVSGAEAASQSSSSSGKNTSSSKSRPTRWLLCYPGSAARDNSSDGSPSSSSDNESAVSTPSPTDHGFKIPNSYSNKRPNSLPVALQNSLRNGDAGIDLLSLDPDERVTPNAASYGNGLGVDAVMGLGADVEDDMGDMDGCVDDADAEQLMGGGLIIPPPPMFSSDPPPPPPSQPPLPPTGMLSTLSPPQQELMVAVEDHFAHSGEETLFY